MIPAEGEDETSEEETDTDEENSDRYMNYSKVHVHSSKANNPR